MNIILSFGHQFSHRSGEHQSISLVSRGNIRMVNFKRTSMLYLREEVINRLSQNNMELLQRCVSEIHCLLAELHSHCCGAVSLGNDWPLYLSAYYSTVTPKKFGFENPACGYQESEK